MTDNCCQICGSKRTLDEKSPAMCQFLCFWTLEGWLGWNARTGKVAIRDERAFRFVPTSPQDPASKISYPKMIAMARAMGWTGQENRVGTFPRTAPLTRAVGR